MTPEDILQITVNPKDPACHDIVAALGAALIGCCLDIHQAEGEMDEDAAIRAAIRALADALADDYLESGTDALSVLHQAICEIGHEIG